MKSIKGLMLVLLSSVFLFHSASIYAQDKSLVPSTEEINNGEILFTRYCVYCHGIGAGDDGAKMLPGTEAISLKYRGQRPALLWEQTNLTFGFMKSVVRNGLASMPPFRKTELTDDQLNNIFSYFSAKQEVFIQEQSRSIK